MKPKPKVTKAMALDHASQSQRIIAEIFNPQLAYNREQAIAKSPYVDVKEQIDFDNLPDNLRDELHRHGLQKELQGMPPRTKITLPKSGNPIHHLIRFVSKHGKPQPYSMRMTSILIFVLLSLVSFAQSLSVSSGVTSEGLTSCMLSAGLKQHEFYFKSTQDRTDADKVAVGYVEKHEYIFGYGYQFHENVTGYAGIGLIRDYTVYEAKHGHAYRKGLRMNSCEIGFRYDLVKFDRVDLGLTCLMSNYSGLSTMLTVKFRLL